MPWVSGSYFDDSQRFQTIDNGRPCEATQPFRGNVQCEGWRREDRDAGGLPKVLVTVREGLRGAEGAAALSQGEGWK